MDYLSIEDFYTVITAQKLNEIIEGDETILDTFELAGMEEMTGYLAVRFDSVKCFDAEAKIPIIVQKLVDIVLYNAHARIMPDNIPKLRVDRYDNAIEWLNKVSEGYINPNLPIKEIEKSTPLRYGNSNPKINHQF